MINALHRLHMIVWHPITVTLMTISVIALALALGLAQAQAAWFAGMLLLILGVAAEDLAARLGAS
jgi:hypothetical protein